MSVTQQGYDNFIPKNICSLKMVQQYNAIYDRLYNLNLYQFMELSIDSIQQVLSYFKTTNKYLFYVGPIYGNSFMNLNDFMPTFEMLTCNDPYFGAHPFIKVPSSLQKQHRCVSGDKCQAEILKDPEVIAYMRSKDPNPNVIYVIIDGESQRLCKENCLNFWGTTSELYSFLGGKIEILSFLKKVSIPYIPNICSRVDSYQHLLSISSELNSKGLVVQSEQGWSGHGTVFIFDEDDYKAYQSQLEDGLRHKIMPFKRLKSFAIGAIATSSGTFIGPLQSELIGHDKLTTCRGGYCGNEIRKSYFEDPQVQMKVRREIFKHTEDLSNLLYKQVKYRGMFGFDYTVDMDTNEVFFMEMNPRMTGSTTLAFQVYEAKGHKFPIFLYHCLQFLGIKINLNVEQINGEWLDLQHYQNEFTHIIFRPFSNEELNLPYNFPAGIWVLQNDALKQVKAYEFRFDVMQKDQIFITPNHNFSKGNIVLKKRCQDYSFKLTDFAKKIIDIFVKMRLKQEN